MPKNSTPGLYLLEYSKSVRSCGFATVAQMIECLFAAGELLPATGLIAAFQSQLAPVDDMRLGWI